MTIGNSTGRGFNGAKHGNGTLTSGGDGDVTTWPGTNAVGIGLRGGDWNHEWVFQRLSDRYHAARYFSDREKRWGGAGCVPRRRTIFSNDTSLEGQA